MKILYLCADTGIPVLGRKGASVHVREMVAAFGRAGHRVVVAAPVASKSPWEEPANLEATLLPLPLGAEATAALFTFKAFQETLGVATSLPGELRRILCSQEMLVTLRRRFASDPPDFIYERASLYATVGTLLAGELGVPLLLELNAPLAAEQSKYRATGFGELAEQAERWVLARADAVLAVSAPLKAHVIALGADPEQVHVFPNGVNPKLFHPAPRDARLRQRWGLNEGPVLGFVGGLRPWHGVTVLPELLERLSGQAPGLQLLVVGDGPLRQELMSGLRERRLAERAVFTGPLPHEEIAPLIREFDVAVAPYPRHDHDFYFSPLKLFEYMGCGAAIVAAAVGQIADVVRDGETGLLVPPGDLEALAAACGRLLADQRLRQRLGEAAAAEAHHRYTWDQSAARAVELARSLAGEKATPAEMTLNPKPRRLAVAMTADGGGG